MKNTYNLSLVRRRIHEALPRPLSAIGESALEAFLAVPGVSLWRPARLGLRELSYVFDIGLPFALIGDNASVQPRRLRAGDAVRDGLYPERCLWNEIHVAAILHAWGAQVCFGAQTTPSAASLEVSLGDGQRLPVDVLHAASADSASAAQSRSGDRSHIAIIPLWERSPDRDGPSRARLIAVNVRSLPHAHEQSVAGLAADVVAVIGFEPRFWIGLQQKEWLYSVRVNPTASVKVPLTIFGNADGGRHSMRFPLLT